MTSHMWSLQCTAGCQLNARSWDWQAKTPTNHHRNPDFLTPASVSTPGASEMTQRLTMTTKWTTKLCNTGWRSQSIWRMLQLETDQALAHFDPRPSGVRTAYCEFLLVFWSVAGGRFIYGLPHSVSPCSVHYFPRNLYGSTCRSRSDSAFLILQNNVRGWGLMLTPHVCLTMFGAWIHIVMHYCTNTITFFSILALSSLLRVFRYTGNMRKWGICYLVPVEEYNGQGSMRSV